MKPRTQSLLFLLLLKNQNSFDMRPKRFAAPLLAPFASIVATFSMVVATHAASDSWTGSTDANWATATNWSTATSAPGAGETATFDGAGNGNTTIDLGEGVTVGALVFASADAAAYTIGSGAAGAQTLTLGTPGNVISTDAAVANHQAFNANLALATSSTANNAGTYYTVTHNSAAHTLSFAGGISASTAGVKTFRVTGSGDAHVAGAITSGSGSVSLFKTGSGALTLSGGATFGGNGVTDGANFSSSAVFREGLTILDGGTYANSGGELVIGGVATHAGAGTDTTLQLGNGTTLGNISWLSIGRGNGNGTATSNLTLDGNATVTATNLSAGFNAGNADNRPKGSITLNGTSRLEITNAAANNANFIIGESDGTEFSLVLNDNAVVTKTGGSADLGNQIQAGVQIGKNGGTGTLTLNGGTFNAASVDLGRGSNASQAAKGTLTVKTGATFNSEGDFRTGFAGNSSARATVDLDGGTLNIGSGTKRRMLIGCWDATQSTVTVGNGGVLNLNTNSDLRFNQQNNVGPNVVTLGAGGAITSYSDNKTTPLGAGVVDLMLGGAAGSNNTFNLDGGTLTVRQVVSSTNNGTRTFNFNGGTLRATGDAATFFGLGTGNARANIRDGGAVIDTNGFNVTIGQALAHTNIEGDSATDGGLTKLGAGTLTLSGASDYTGPTTVSAGRLHVTGDIFTSPVSLGAATLSGDGFIGPVTVTDPAAVLTNSGTDTGSLSLDALSFDSTGTVSLVVSGASSRPVDVTNNLNIGSGFTVNVPSAPAWTNGQTYTLISYGSLTGSPASITKGTIAGLGGRQAASIGDSGSAITLTISGDTPVWTGAQSNIWSTAVIDGAKNWKLETAGTLTDFLATDQVLFNDTATGSTDIDIASADVQVASAVFNNSSLGYTVSSSGGFGIADGSEPASLLKDGSGTVILNTNNSYTGTTTIRNGTLQLGDGALDGDIAASSAIVNDGTLVFHRSGGSFTYGNVISGGGEVIKDGPGTQILTGDNTLFGDITITAGTLQVGNGGTSGTLGTAWVTNNGSLVFNRSSGFTVNGTIEGTGSVTQAGTGPVTLAGANSYSGGTTISPGSTILVGANDALGTGVLTLAQGAVLGTNPGGALSNAIVAPAGTVSTFTTSGGNLTLNGNLSGGGNINRTATGGAASVFLAGDNSGFTGTFTVENNGNAATRFTSAGAGSANAKWVFNNPTSGRVSVESPGATIHFGSLTGTGIITGQGTGTTTLEVGNLGLNDLFTGVINQAGAGVVAITKVGSGTWTLTGANAYTGDTTVNAGVLVVGGSSIPDAGRLVINGGKVQPAGTEVVDTLFFGNTPQAAGTWGATGSGAQHIDDTRFTGTGVVSVTTTPPPPAENTFDDWAAANAPGQTLDQDHDGDGVPNGIEYFMGESGSGFTPNPAPVDGTVTWPMGADYEGDYGTDFEVQSSSDLSTWSPVDAASVTVTAGTSVAYSLPPGSDRLFVRLVVKN